MWAHGDVGPRGRLTTAKDRLSQRSWVSSRSFTPRPPGAPVQQQGHTAWTPTRPQLVAVARSSAMAAGEAETDWVPLPKRRHAHQKVPRAGLTDPDRLASL